MFKRVFKSRFVTASCWVYLATVFINGGNYLYHLIMGRLLGPAQYGELATAISILYILNIPLVTATFVIIKFTSEYKGRNAFDVISGMHQYLEHSSFKYGLLFTLCLVLFSQKINMFFHLSSEILFIFVIINFFIGFFPIVNKSILQGSADFFGFAITSIGEVIAKLVFAIFFVIVGFKVTGAFAGIIFSGLIAYLISYFFMSRYKKTKSMFHQKRKLLIYAIPVFFVNLGFTSLFTSDILLVRHFFSGIDSGYYASLSVLSKIIFYAVNPFVSIMFPLVSENHAKGEGYIKYLFVTVSITIIGAICIILLFFSFPQLMISLLFGNAFLSGAPVLGWFGIFIGIYSLCIVITNYYLAINRSSVLYLVCSAAFLQIILIWFFHASLLQVIQMSLISIVLLLIALSIYYPNKLYLHLKK